MLCEKQKKWVKCLLQCLKKYSSLITAAATAFIAVLTIIVVIYNWRLTDINKDLLSDNQEKTLLLKREQDLKYRPLLYLKDRPTNTNDKTLLSFLNNGSIPAEQVIIKYRFVDMDDERGKPNASTVGASGAHVEVIYPTQEISIEINFSAIKFKHHLFLIVYAGYYGISYEKENEKKSYNYEGYYQYVKEKNNWVSQSLENPSIRINGFSAELEGIMEKLKEEVQEEREQNNK